MKPLKKKSGLEAAKPNPKNPRKISNETLDGLRLALKRFGDLGGIVFNNRSGQLVGGHQRIEAFRAAKAEASVHLTTVLRKPDAAGTIAFGHVEVNGTRYAYRVVDWDNQTESAAMLAANKFSGEFDNDALAEVLRSLAGSEDILLTGFLQEEIDKLIKVDPATFPAVDENLPVRHKCPKCGHVWSGKPS